MKLFYTWKAAKAYRQGRVKPLRGIVFHSTDGRAVGDIATLTGPKVSVHWYVTRAGRIWHFVQDADTAYHAGRARAGWSNAETIGIEHEHFDGQDDWPLPQIAACARLVAAIEQKHGRLLRAGHAEIALPAGRKVDPVGYPWDSFRAELQTAAFTRWEFAQAI